MTDDKFRETLDLFNQVALSYHEEASETGKERVRELLMEQIKSFAQQAWSVAGISAQPCPPGWILCPEGHCVPPGVLC
jgi:hypothetical protein